MAAHLRFLRALRLLVRERWLRQARTDAERLADEDLDAEADAWRHPRRPVPAGAPGSCGGAG
ncbi:hypothetical protein [Streptomyces sp. KLOTTS4A1]|uniref:hypothetical protein n=1 Tax=Streptomyces sp. KLOTTS4A1 TaxID=3390996 RepID=UPI0039F58351